MLDNSIDVISKARVYDGFFAVDEVNLKYRKPDGSESEEVNRACVERGDAVGVLVYNSAKDSFVFVRQVRYPTLRHGDLWPIEIVAGAIDKDEDAETAAVRETEEEIGIKPTELIFLSEMYSSPGGMSEMLTLYAVELADFAVPGGLGGLEGEDLQVVEIPRREAYEMIDTGKIRDGKTQIAMLRFLQKHPLPS